MAVDAAFGFALTLLAWLALLFVVLQGKQIVERMAARRSRTGPTTLSHEDDE